MIILIRDSELYITAVYSITEYRPYDAYYRFLREKAESMGIKINSHYYNIMNHKDHHPHLSEEEYRRAEKRWLRYLKRYDIVWFIENRLHGTKKDYSIISKK